MNWKFRDAVSILDGAKNDETRRFVKALAAMFENEGWMRGLMAEVIEAAVSYICVLEGWEPAVSEFSLAEVPYRRSYETVSDVLRDRDRFRSWLRRLRRRHFLYDTNGMLVNLLSPLEVAQGIEDALNGKPCPKGRGK
jgi:hypothetical protein